MRVAVIADTSGTLGSTNAVPADIAANGIGYRPD